MNANFRRIPTRFGPETRFEVTPVPEAPFRAGEESALERLKHSLLRERLADIWDPALNSLIRRAANEASALAWVTSYPLLVFPSLFEEKIEMGLRHAEHQLQVWARSRELMAA